MLWIHHHHPVKTFWAQKCLMFLSVGCICTFRPPGHRSKQELESTSTVIFTGAGTTRLCNDICIDAAQEREMSRAEADTMTHSGVVILMHVTSLIAHSRSSK